MGNPFTVNVGEGWGPGLSGLANVLDKVGEKKEAKAKEQAKMVASQEANVELVKLFEKGDYKGISRLIAKHPNIRQDIDDQLGVLVAGDKLETDRRSKEQLDFMRKILTSNSEDISGHFDERIKSLGIQERDPAHTVRERDDWKERPNEERKEMELIYKSLASPAEVKAYEKQMEKEGGGASPGSEQVFFESIISGFTEEQKVEAREIKAGIKPRAVSNSTLTAIQLGMLDELLKGEKKLSGAREEGTLGAQLAFLPHIRAKVKLAEAEATERGEVFTDLARMNAALPGLKETVGKLKELALLATSTYGGRSFDFASKELGFGSTKGANARAKFIAIVANQILPLLKPTFGAAFTLPEGEKLEATLGDPNASPDEKLAQLEAFMEQKERTIREKEAQLNVEPTSFTVGGDLNALSDDELLEF